VNQTGLSRAERWELTRKTMIRRLVSRLERVGIRADIRRDLPHDMITVTLESTPTMSISCYIGDGHVRFRTGATYEQVPIRKRRFRADFGEQFMAAIERNPLRGA
jgi:hypothetical protein